MPRCGNIGPEPAERDAAGQQDPRSLRVEGAELKAASVETSQPADRFAEDSDGHERDHPGGQRTPQAVPEAVVEERPTHERVAPADQLGDLDFVAAVLDVEPD